MYIADSCYLSLLASVCFFLCNQLWELLKCLWEVNLICGVLMMCFVGSCDDMLCLCNWRLRVVVNYAN